MDRDSGDSPAAALPSPPVQAPAPAAPESKPGGRSGGRTPADVVTMEQRLVLYHLGLPGPYHGRSAPGTAVSVAERLRLVQLVLTVLAQAAQRAEDECLRIMSRAETRAAEMVQEAHDDVAHLSWWLPSSPATIPSGTFADTAPHRSEDRIDTNSVDDRSLPSGARDDTEAEFFASFAGDHAERWRFMDDGELVGVGATVRKLLRRPPRAREQTDEQERS